MEKLRIGMLGVGHWGPNLVRNFHENPQCSVEWVCDVDPVRLSRLTEKYPALKTTQSWENVIHSDSVDAVVISTPTASHYSIAKLALEKGKHVFVEKPIATSPQEALHLHLLAEQRGLKLMVGHIFLFNPAVQFIKGVLDNNGLGQIYYLYSQRTNLGPIRADVNALWDLAPHDIAVLIYLLGNLPLDVSARGSSFINPPVADIVFANLRFPNQIFANLHLSWLDPKKDRELVIVGSEKMLVFNDLDTEQPVRIFDKTVGPALSEGRVADTLVLFRKSILEGNCFIPKIDPGEPLSLECRAFIDLVLHNKPQPSTSWLGYQVVQVLDRISTSMAREGAPTSLTDGLSSSEPQVGTPISSFELR